MESRGRMMEAKKKKKRGDVVVVLQIEVGIEKKNEVMLLLYCKLKLELKWKNKRNDNRTPVMGDNLHFSSNNTDQINVNYGQTASFHESQMPDATSKEITLNDVMDAVQMLTIRIGSLELVQKEMRDTYIQSLHNTKLETPTLRNAMNTSYYSPDVEGNGGKSNNPSVVAKEMEKLKNYETINISDNTEEERSNFNKRTTPNTNFVRSGNQCKRQNTANGKFPFVYDTTKKAVKGHGQGADTTNVPFSSDYRRRFNPEEIITTSSTMPRKLSFTPSPGEGGSKGKGCLGVGSHGKMKATLKSVCVKRHSPAKRTKTSAAVGRSASFRNTIGQVVPKNFRCAVKTTPDMKLDQVEVRICAYVFQEQFDPRDIIFKVGNNEYSRADFECMCPGMLVSSEVLLMMALKVTATQKTALSQTLWCMPPQFAEDVLKGTSVEDLHIYYGADWMGRFDRLKLIYVPIEDSYGHWFLMAVSLDKHEIFNFDSHLKDGAIPERRSMISKIGATLSKLIEVVYDGNYSFCLLTDFQFWEITDAKGIPNYGTSDNSALWVAEWLNMQNNFATVLVGVPVENVVRMMVTMRLLMGSHNEVNNELIKNSRNYWQIMTTPDDQDA